MRNSADAGHSLLGPWRQLLWSSQKLWENPVRDVVVKCDDGLVAKVVVTSGNYTEYTTLQYLAGREPKIPAPKPHGLIRTGGICIIFVSYILSMMLTKAWPTSGIKTRCLFSSISRIISCAN
jgi:hypothetical protein